MANFKEAYTFDDVLIVPKYSDIETRDNIDIGVRFLGYDLKLPIISSNMDYVTGGMMGIAMQDNGGWFVLHRFMTDENFYGILESWIDRGIYPSFSIGIRDADAEIERAEKVASFGGKDICTVTVDVAHGHHQRVANMVKKLKDRGFPRVIAGNVATPRGYRFLADAGADAIKVGIGPGSVCTTREVTGAGVPQLTAIMECALEQDLWGPAIIADGGIKNSGDIVKALAAGADMVMLGNLLAGTNEAPGQFRVDLDGTRWKPYRGQSIFGVNGEKFTPEGISGWIKEKGPVADVLKRLAGGIRSGLSYVGAHDIKELRQKTEFVKVSQATHIESGTRVFSDLPLDAPVKSRTAVPV